jgi:hypothetical protein
MRIPLSIFVVGAALSLDGGCGGSSSASCQRLMNDYTNALPAALACDPGAPNQCQLVAMSGTAKCSCGPIVQDPTQLNAIVAQLHAAGCIPAPVARCLPCTSPPFACVANDAGGGTCTPQPSTAG